MTDTSISRDDKVKLISARVTLDGAPATIGGTALPFAEVSRLDGKGGRVEYAWTTVARIVANGGRFVS